MDREILLVLIAINQAVMAQSMALIRLSESDDAGFQKAMARLAEKTDDLNRRLSKFLPS
jgi:hypothetical protein